MLQIQSIVTRVETKDWLLLGIGAFLGAFGGYIISWRFARAATNELRHEAGELHKTLAVLVYGMERQGWVDVNRNAEGRITGINFRIEPPPGSLGIEGHPPTVAVGLKGKVGITGDIQIQTSDNKR